MWIGDWVRSRGRRGGGLMLDKMGSDVPRRRSRFLLTDSVIMPSLVLRGKIYVNFSSWKT
jgi:hypothetical protein